MCQAVGGAAYPLMIFLEPQCRSRVVLVWMGLSEQTPPLASCAWLGLLGDAEHDYVVEHDPIVGMGAAERGLEAADGPSQGLTARLHKPPSGCRTGRRLTVCNPSAISMHASAISSRSIAIFLCHMLPHNGKHHLPIEQWTQMERTYETTGECSCLQSFRCFFLFRHW